MSKLGICKTSNAVSDIESSEIYQTLDFKLIFPDPSDYSTFSQASKNYEITLSDEPIDGFLSVAQGAIITMATDKTSDTVYPDKGSKIRAAAMQGVIINSDQLVHVANFAFNDAKNFSNNNTVSSLSNEDLEFSNYSGDELAEADKAIYITNGQLIPTALSTDSVLFTASFESSKGELITTEVNTSLFT